ncbi:hypothetical protein BDF14DRAFT_1772403 [Spinellus fusiger]|nr:hypothetical protein BDF14DRAFT_1772403 [Spinellus fusiger]
MKESRAIDTIDSSLPFLPQDQLSLFLSVLFSMAFHTRIRWITFDAFNTLFKIRGNVQDLYASEARRFCLNVSASDIKKNFGPVYKNHLKEFPFYGLAQGKTSRLWWREVRYLIIEKKKESININIYFSFMTMAFSTLVSV